MILYLYKQMHIFPNFGLPHSSFIRKIASISRIGPGSYSYASFGGPLLGSITYSSPLTKLRIPTQYQRLLVIQFRSTIMGSIGFTKIISVNDPSTQISFIFTNWSVRCCKLILALLLLKCCQITKFQHGNKTPSLQFNHNVAGRKKEHNLSKRKY